MAAMAFPREMNAQDWFASAVKQDVRYCEDNLATSSCASYFWVNRERQLMLQQCLCRRNGLDDMQHETRAR